MTEATATLDIVPYWPEVNDDLIRLVDTIPDEQMDYAPKDGLWPLRRVLVHVAGARDYWMGRVVRDGGERHNVHETAKTKDDIKRELARTHERVRRFLADPSKLTASYREEGETQDVDGHWIAFHVLEHDIHHRADVLYYLAMLGVEVPPGVGVN